MRVLLRFCLIYVSATAWSKAQSHRRGLALRPLVNGGCKRKLMVRGQVFCV